jgi:enoyl-CoA hydratase/carnithine racemase
MDPRADVREHDREAAARRLAPVGGMVIGGEVVQAAAAAVEGIAFGGGRELVLCCRPFLRPMSGR